MATCSCCGTEFDVSYARRFIGRRYGAGTYNEFFPNGDVCEDCAIGPISEVVATADELKELMGSSWYDD